MRGGFASGKADAKHKRKGFFLAGFFEGEPEIAVVLEIEAVKFRELAGIVRDGTGGGVSEFLREVTTEVA